MSEAGTSELWEQGSWRRGAIDGPPWTNFVCTVSDGTRLHGVEIGSGPPVVLLHGAGGSAVGGWFKNGIAPALAATNRVIALDMRGHGRSEPGPPDSRERMPQDVLDVMDRRGVDRAHVGGYSMGASVAVRMLCSDPHRFTTAILGGFGIPETEEWADRVPPDKEGPDPDAEDAVAAVRASKQARGEEVGNIPGLGWIGGGDRPHDHTPEWVARRRKMMAALDLTAIAFPVLAINGEFDRPLARTHRMWRELQQFTSVVLPGKGHLSAIMPGFMPPLFVETMVRFVTAYNPS